MAKLKYGIFGPLSGKIGPVVGATWKGIPYLREAPKKGKKSKTKSIARVANEQKFKYGNDWMVPFHPYLTVGFQNLAIGKTAISAAFSANYSKVIVGTYPDFEVDYAKVVISAGDLPGIHNAAVKLTAPDVLELSWLANYDKNTAYNDQLMLVVYSPELQIADGFIGSAQRRDQRYAFNLNEEMTGKVLEVYISVTSLDRKRIADSIYLGRVMPL